MLLDTTIYGRPIRQQVQNFSPKQQWNVPLTNCYATAADFTFLGSELANKYKTPCTISKEKMVEVYGATPIILQKLWKLLCNKGQLHHQCHPLHLLWWLSYVKHYPTKKNFERFTQWSAKCTRKWMKRIRAAIMRIIPFVVSNCYYFFFIAF